MKRNGKGIYEHDIESIEQVKGFIFTKYYLILKSGKRVRINNSIGKMLWNIQKEEAGKEE